MSGPTRTPRRALASALLLAGIAVAASAVAPVASAAPMAVTASRAATTASTATTAQAAPPAPKPGQISWSALPSDAKGPDLRSKFVYNDIAPGSVIHDRVAIVNRSLASVSFSIYATDSTGTTPQNVLTWLKVGDKPKDIGRWEQFQLGKQITPDLPVIIGGRRGIVVPFTIKVPAFATPGDHTGAVMAQVGLPRQVSKNSSVIIYNRIAVPIELRVKGAYHTGLQVQSVSTSFGNSINPFGGGSAIVSFTVANTGNLRLAGSDLVKVTGPFGMSAMAKAPKLPVVLPGDSVRVTAIAGGLYPAGPMSAHVSLSPAWVRDEAQVSGMSLAASAADASLFAVPWSLLGLILLLIAAGFGAWYFLRWRRRQQVAEVTEAVQRARREAATSLAARQPVAAAVGTSAASGSAEATAPETGSTDAAGDPARPDADNPATGDDNGPDSGSTTE
jgi:hypothetical protein